MNKFIIPNFIKIVMDKLKENGFESFIVGGSVRDFILGKDPSDYDITTNALPDEIKNVFKDYKIINNNGEKHGTITVMIKDNSVEITTYRTETEYTDHRHPDNVSFTSSLKEDLKRRDFTMNAIAFDGKNFVDYFNGIDDLKLKKIKAVGNPEERFNEDALRILRALRFASVLDFKIEWNTSAALLNYKDLLNNIAKERIQEELNKILLGKNSYKILKYYRDVFSVFIPELKPCFDFDQKNKYHPHDLYEHTLQVVKGVDNILELKLAALLHDIGKPESITKDQDENGNEYYHFYGHAIKSANIANEVLKSLKYSNQVIKLVVFLVKYHDYQFSGTVQNTKKLLNIIDQELPTFDKKSVFEMLLNLRESDRNDHDYSKSATSFVDLNSVKIVLNNILEQNNCFNVKNLKINGYDLLDLGFKGKEIGDILKLLVQKVINEELENGKDILLQEVKRLKSNNLTEFIKIIQTKSEEKIRNYFNDHFKNMTLAEINNKTGVATSIISEIVKGYNLEDILNIGYKYFK